MTRQFNRALAKRKKAASYTSGGFFVTTIKTAAHLSKKCKRRRLTKEKRMAQDFSRAFYNSAAWKSCRDSYRRSKGGLCEDCLQRGIIRSGAEVHHIRPLTIDNIGDPKTTLSWSNLRLLCKDCHAKRHGSAKRYKIDFATGVVETR